MLQELDSPRGPARRAAVPASGAAALPGDVERRLAHLAGVDLAPQPGRSDEPAIARRRAISVDDYRRRLLRVAEQATVGSLVLVVLSALVTAWLGAGGLRVHEAALAGWGFGGAVCGIALGALAPGTASSSLSDRRRRWLSAALVAGLLTCVSGVVTSAGGVSGQAWVLFLPAVLVTAAATTPYGGLLVGVGGSLGLYVAGLASHTMTTADLGRLLVLLPMFPAVGAAAGLLSSAARQSAADEAAHRAALERDVVALSEVLSDVAEGDLSRVPAVPEDATAASTALAVAFADTLLALRRLVRQLTAGVERIAGNATDVVRTAGEHTSGVVSQTAAVQQTTSTIEQLAATAASIAETAERVSRYAGATLRHVHEGVEAVDASSAAMERIAADVEGLAERSHGLGERTQRIGSTLDVIDDISRRTSMLALNAAIEAARAGEHGRGFSLVADEVRKLADKAQDATARIAEIVDDIVRETDATIAASEDGAEAVQVGRRLSQDVVDALGRISAMVDRTTAAAREISVATRQQRAASDAVVLAMAQVTASSGRYETGSKRYVAAAAELDALASSLRETTGRFKVAGRPDPSEA